jgi:hypothetical protein
VSGVPPCYRLVGEPSRKAAGRPIHHGHANRIGVRYRSDRAAVRVAIQYLYLTVQLYYMYYFIADDAAASAMQERAAPSHASDSRPAVQLALQPVVRMAVRAAARAAAR